MYLIPQPTDPRISTTPYFGSAPGVSGYHLDFISATQCFLNPGYARAFNNDFAITFSTNEYGKPEYILIDIDVLGAGGCYPNAMSSLVLANKTVMGVYVIGDSTGKLETNAVIATGNNFLPAGYDTFRRVALVYIDNTTNQLIKWIQAGLGNDKQYTLQDPVSALAAGTATTYTLIDLTAGDGVVPPGHANYVELGLEITAAAAGRLLFVAPSVLNPVALSPVGISSPAAGPLALTAEIVAGITGSDVHSQTANAAIKYKVSNADSPANIFVCGFTDSLGNNLF